MTTFYVQDPEARLDYYWDWAAEWLLPPDTIATFSVTGDMTIEDENETDGVVVAWLSGGAVGSKIVVTCAVESVEGRKDQRSICIEIKER